MSDPLRPDPANAIEAWAARVRANREQVERRRLVLPERGDFYSPIAAWFRADPRRTGDPTLDALRALVTPEDTVLDVGAGGGRYSLPLALHAREVIAVEPSEAMRSVLAEGMAEHGIDNIRVVETTWPCDEPLRADVALISHVGYDIEDFGPFLDAMEGAAGRLCVAAMLSRPPPSRADPFWEAVHGEPRDPCRRSPSSSPCNSPAGACARSRLSNTAVSPTTPRTTSSASSASSSGSRKAAPRTTNSGRCSPTISTPRTGASSSTGIRVRSGS